MAVSDQKIKPVFDEESLGKLLEAAHVLQQHNRSRAPSAEEHIEPLAPPQQDIPIAPWEEPETVAAETTTAPAENANHDFTLTLAHIVEAQHQIKTRNLSLDEAAVLVAKRAACIANASGAAVNLLEDEQVRTVAGCGRSALPAGTKLPVAQSLSKASLRTRQIVRCSDINQEFLVDVDECRRRGIMALIAVPIFHDAQVAGSLEIYFADAQQFTEPDIHACQLTAGLITEVLARDDKKAAAATPATDPCPECGHNFQPLELFCGKCGAARAKPAEGLPNPAESLESLWNAARQGQTPSAQADTPSGEIAFADAEALLTPDDPADIASPEQVKEAEAEAAAATHALAKPDDAHWSSAAEARDYLESVAASTAGNGWSTFWRAHRGDLSLAGAVVLVAIAIRWGIWSSPVAANTKPPAPGHRRRVDPEAGLSLGDRMLIDLGLADPPDPPDDKGNPATQVWVDAKTGLYYCPGAESYGKTAKGKYESQRDAQLDEYEPADRRACE